MPSGSPLSIKLITAGNRSSQFSVISNDCNPSSQTLPSESVEIISPTVAYGLYVAVVETEYAEDGLCPVTPRTAAWSPQNEKIPWVAPYTATGITPSEKDPQTINASRPPSGYFISKKQVRRCSIVSAIAIAIVITFGVVLGISLAAAGNIREEAIIDVLDIEQATLPVHHPLSNDTSIAALETEGDQRHIFYQTTSGTIQHASYSGEWSIQDLGLNDARNQTPLSAVLGDGGAVYLFYITNNSTLASARMIAGSWKPYPISTSSTISSQTRQLAASRVSSYNGDVSDFQLFVLTQSSAGSISLIHLSTNSTQSSFEQTDITAYLNESNSTGKSPFDPPCAVAANVSNASTSNAPFLASNVDYSWVAVCFDNLDNVPNSVVGAGYDGKKLSYYEFGTIKPADSTSPAPVQSTSYDLVVAVVRGQLSILYVAGGILISNRDGNLDIGTVKNDNSVYPFTRLGAFLSADGSYYVYHQLDGSTIAEAVFDSMADWTTSNITIGK